MNSLAAVKHLFRRPITASLVTVCIAALLWLFHADPSSTSKPTFTRKMHIQWIHLWPKASNNYAYLVTDEKTKDAVIIDPADPKPVCDFIKKATADGGSKLVNIINTHHHGDHAGGNSEMLKTYPVPIIGGVKCNSVSMTPAHNTTFNVGNIKVTALHTPCHTQDSICYYFEDGNERVVFTGDTLFHGGCGRFFEGSAQEMDTALNKILGSLPDDTKVYPGHEYTAANVKFGIKVSQSPALQKLQAFANANEHTQGQFTIGDEKQHNVFMRLEDPDVQKFTGKTERVDVMAALREKKNNS